MASSSENDLGDLADLILNVGRLVRARTPTGGDIVELTETERHVMRIVDLHPGSSPSEIADLSRLQRSNVSTALRTLEDKGMVDRRPTSGRSIAVTPTERAHENLRQLQAAWADELRGIITTPASREAVTRCIEVLAQMEQHLIRPPADPR
ncbi:MarR family winged helix-turn-helix transcriptional regulator [Brachybacterium hainanense]|uniref:MarR family winged helix-turn-helix transcriptional regulator n=1 Tax=Brachybacterium hainanense TaxID=1541174 RepID=A0ABV6RGH8_9MICO